MWNSRTRALALALFAFMPLSVASTAWAQDYPTRPVKIIVPFPPGGGADTVGRMFAQKLGELWAQPVVVENKPGASTIIASDLVAKSPPDGYTLLVAITAHVVNPSLFSKLPYNTAGDFAPVTMIGLFPNVVVVNPSVPAHSINEFIALARTRPAGLNYASGGKGLSNHLSAERFKRMANVDIVNIPYQGGGPAITAVIGGQVDVMFNSITSLMPYITSGKLRPLAITSAKRSPLLPNLPTVAESGLPGYEEYEWLGLLVPAGTPPAIVSKINADIIKVLGSKDVQDRLVTQLGFVSVGNSPQEFADYLKAETAKWAKLLKEAGIERE